MKRSEIPCEWFESWLDTANIQPGRWVYSLKYPADPSRCDNIPDSLIALPHVFSPERSAGVRRVMTLLPEGTWWFIHVYEPSDDDFAWHYHKEV